MHRLIFATKSICSRNGNDYLGFVVAIILLLGLSFGVGTVGELKAARNQGETAGQETMEIYE